MSGIVGIYYLDGRPVDPADLTRMVDTLTHRGPDGSGTWHDGPVGLGHRMLWTTQESLHERLPLTSANGRYTITTDARIDNREELASVLSDPTLTGHAPDSAYILAAYERWGDRCPDTSLATLPSPSGINKRKSFSVRETTSASSPFTITNLIASLRSLPRSKGFQLSLRYHASSMRLPLQIG